MKFVETNPEKAGERYRSFSVQRPLCVIACAAAGGIVAGRYCAFMPGVFCLGVLCGAGLAVFLKRSARSGFAGILTAVFFLFCAYSSWAVRPSDVPAGTWRVRGIVSGEATVRDSGSLRVLLRGVSGTDADGQVRQMGRVYWTFQPRDDEELVRFGASLEDGDLVEFTGTVYRPSGRVNPFGYDFSLYLAQMGIRTGISGCGEPVLEKGVSILFRGWMLRVRKALSDQADRIFGAYSVWPRTLLLGEKEKLDGDIRASFSDLGIAHILAVSGLHVGLISGFLLLILRLFAASPKVRFAVLAVFLGFYCALLDFAAPVVRAAVLVLLEAARQVLRRSGDSLTHLSAAFLLILLFAPLSLFSAGFQMTFGALLGITLLRVPIGRALRPIPFERVRDALAVTLSAECGVLIPAASAYHRFSVAGLILSPVACLFMGILLPVYLVIYLLGCVWLPLGQALAGLLHGMIGWILDVLTALSGEAYVSVSVPSFPAPVIIGFCVCLVLCTRYVLLTGRARALLGGGAALCAGLILLAARPHGVSYIQFSTGQADCAVVTDGGQTIVVDTGEYGGDLASWLLSNGRRADIVILTHLHTDHCAGILDLLEDRVPVGKVILPCGAGDQKIDSVGVTVLERLAEKGIPVEEMGAGDTFATAGTQWTVLWPQRDRIRTGQDANAYSLSLLCEAEGVRFLMMGDLTGEYEMYPAVDADVLKLAHHGSNGSSSRAFLEAVSPQIVIIPCREGRNLPGEETLRRLADAGPAVYRTDETGALTLVPEEGRITVRTYLPSGPADLSRWTAAGTE